MKRLVLAVLLAAALPAAHAAPPTAAQVDALLEAMDVRATSEAMTLQLQASTREMAASMPGGPPSPEQREHTEHAIAETNRFLREVMDWRRLEPAYRAVYADVFTAREIEAMTRFYASSEGRSMLAKMPEVMARTMRALRPAMDEAFQRLQAQLGARPEAGTGSEAAPAP